MGKPVEYTRLLFQLAEFRPRYDDPARLPRPPAMIRLARGDAAPALVLCCTMSMLAGPHEYARLAGALRGVRDVYALAHPGFAAGEDLPATLDTLLRTHAGTVSRTIGEAPFVLAGHSGGAMVANALTAEMARQGRPPAAQVLLDSYPPDSPVMAAWIPQLLTSVLAAADGGAEADDAGTTGAYTPMDDYRTTAWAAYLDLFGDWCASAVPVPTLLVRARQPLHEWTGAGDWRAAWPFPHAVTDTPGDHFSMLGDHAAAVAGRVDEWLREEGC
jgi:thioesterase domain-containing protein